MFAANGITFEIAPNKLRHVDVALFIETREAVTERTLVGSPHLAIEVVPPGENALDLHATFHLYPQHGARAVGAVWPDTKVVDIDGDIEYQQPVPAFRLAVRDLIANPTPHLETLTHS